MSDVRGYVIRHPGLEKDSEFDAVYIFHRDPNELKDRFYEGFNPIMECRPYWPKSKRCDQCGHEREVGRDG